MNTIEPLPPLPRNRLRPRNWPVWVVPLLLVPILVMGSLGAQSGANDIDSPHHYLTRQLDGLAIALLVGSLVTLLFRRRYPVATMVAIAGFMFVYYLNAYVYGPAALVGLVAVLSGILAGHRVLAWAGTFGGFAAFYVLTMIIGVRADERGKRWFAPDTPDLTGLAFVLGWALVALIGGELVRITTLRQEEAATERREEERRRASDERLRMARELHDVLAHNISMINVQAGVALHLMDEQPEQARTALAAIKEASKEALTEMRSVIGVLRQQGEEAPRSPTAGLARLEELLDRARAAGLRVNTEIDTTEGLPAGIDLAAFRLVQESLTNVTRHAGPGPVTAWVRIAYGEGQISVQIDDDGRGAPLLHDHSGGNGLHGMRERVAALGGEFSAGPRPGGGFRVRAVLPVQDSARTAEPSETSGVAEGK